MAITFELTGKKAVVDVEEFCQIKKELTYVGRFTNRESKVIPGAIVQYNGQFYTTEVTTHDIESGKIQTSVKLIETSEYVPEECQSLTDCSIFIEIWNSNNRYPNIYEDDMISSDTDLICTYAFNNNQLEYAKEIAENNKFVDIFIDKMPISKKHFLEN